MNEGLTDQSWRLNMLAKKIGVIYKIIQKALDDTNFLGATGHVGFLGADRVGTTKIEQLQAGCPDGWHLCEKVCYKFVNVPFEWHRAMTSCRGNLAKLTSDFEWDFIREYMLKNHNTGKETYWYLNTTREDQKKNTVDLGTGQGACYVEDFVNQRRKDVNCLEFYPFICQKTSGYYEMTIALQDLNTDEFIMESAFIWPGNTVPLDHIPIKEVYRGMSPTLYICVCLAAFLGFVLASVCLIFNIYFRNQRHIKLSSPSLNNLILIGAMMVYLSLCLTTPETNDVNQTLVLRFCKAHIIFLSMGFVLCFGALLSKTWRVYKVAAIKTPKKVVIADRHLFIIIAVILVIDAVILMAWFVISPVTVEKELLPYKSTGGVSDELVQEFIYICTSDWYFHWQMTLFVYNGLLMVIGIFLAWETRHVKIAALNDSKLIGISVYNVVLLSVIAVGISVALNSSPSIAYIFCTVIIFFCATSTIILIFIPKMISVYKYPEGQPITTLKKSTKATDTSNTTKDSPPRSSTHNSLGDLY